MLSAKTIKLIQSACDISNKTYEYGGLSFRYSLSTSYLMTLKKRSRISKLRAEQNTSFYLDELEVIAEFFDLAMCADGEGKVSNETSIFVSQLIDLLESDFPDLPRCVIEPVKGLMSSDLELLVLGKDYYHEILLQWSPS